MVYSYKTMVCTTDSGAISHGTMVSSYDTMILTGPDHMTECGDSHNG